MIVVDVLLACNLVLFVYCAVRAPRRARPGIDELVAAARGREHGAHAGALIVPATPRAPSNVIPFRSRDQLRMAHARAAHPSSSAHH